MQFGLYIKLALVANHTAGINKQSTLVFVNVTGNNKVKQSISEFIMIYGRLILHCLPHNY